MTEFILDMGDTAGAARYAALSPFVQGYIEAAFFTSTGPDNAEEGLEHASFAELAIPAINRIVKECEAWERQNASVLALAYASDDYEEIQAGRDYWFTRNGHGVGFWDREALCAIKVGKNNETNLGDLLADRARHSERNLVRSDDGLIYHE